jgi:biopolymer transport protein ExbB
MSHLRLNADNTNNFANSTLYFMSRAGANLFGADTLDEARISNTTRSAGWIATEYNNQNSPATFYTVSTVS